MRTLAILILVAASFSAFAQRQSRAEIAFQEALDLHTDNKPYEAVDAFRAFMRRFPYNRLSARAHYNIAYIYFELADYDSSAQVFKEILAMDYDEREPNNIMEPYALYKHNSARFLAEISLLVKQWDDAERYIQMFDKEYPYQHFCGNEWAAYDIMKATMETRLHEGRGQIDSAVRDLIPHIFYNGLASNDEAVRLLKDILKRNYSDEEVIAEMNLALQRIEFKRKGSPPTTVFFGVTVSFDEDVNDLQEARKILRSNPVVVPFLGEDEK